MFEVLFNFIAILRENGKISGMHPDQQPTCPSMVSRVEAKFREYKYLRDINLITEDQLNILLTAQDNPRSTLIETTLTFIVTYYNGYKN